MATKGKESSTNVGVRVPNALYKRFETAARTSHRSLSGEVRRLIEQRVEEFEAEQRVAEAA